MLSKADVLALVARALGVAKVDEESSMENVDGWDSLAHLGLLTALDEATGGSAAGIDELAGATSVREILALLASRKLLAG